MQFIEPGFDGRIPIDAYGNGGFRLSGSFYKGSQLLLPSGIHPWPVKDVSGLSVEAIRPVLEEARNIDILLVGCGASIARLPKTVTESLHKVRIGYEFMDTGAACRTFNILLSEDRYVAAALIAVREA